MGRADYLKRDKEMDCNILLGVNLIYTKYI